LRNDGQGIFTQITPASIGIAHNAGDGITTADIDNDGDLDMLLASDNEGHLYRNNGSAFSFVQSFANTDGYMGGFADLDNDGDVDLVFAGDEVCYLNNGSGIFSAGPAISITGIDDPRAIGFADIDNDGDLDFAIGCKRSRNWLIRNDFNAGNWLKVRLISPQGQAGAYGAKTRVYPPNQAGGALIGMRESRSNNGYLGQDAPVLHFGLGALTAADVVVTFLDGSTVTLHNVTANQTVTIDGMPADHKAPVISNVAASSISSTTASIGWTTTEISDTQVEYGLTTSYGSSSPLNSSLVTSHTTTLSSLQANTTYHYRVKSRDAAGNLTTSGDFTFMTLGQSSTIFADNFNAASLNGNNWRKGTNAGNQATVASNALELRASGNVSGWIITANNYAALNTTVSVKVTTPNDDGNLGLSPTYNLSSPYGIFDQANWYRFYIYRNGHSGTYRLYVQWKKNGVDNGLDVTGNLVITGTVHLRLRFDNTLIHFEASLDGVSWIDTYNEAFGLPGYTLNSPFYYELAGYNTALNGVPTVDDFAINSYSAPAPNTQPPQSSNVAYANVEEIFANNCARCHQGATAPAGLVLLPGQAYGNIVNVPSTEYSPWQRVQPGDRTISWLFEKLTNSAPPVGSKMGSLSADEIELIGRWIDQGATTVPVPPYAALQFRTASLGNAEINIAYSAGLTVWGALPPYRFSVLNGSLPPGLALDPASGNIFGVPTRAESYNFIIRVSDSQTPAATLDRAYSLEVFNTQDHWQLPAGFLIENVLSGLHLPVNLAFVPNPGPNPADPYFYVTLLYGDIVMVQRNFQKQTYATGLLNFAPTGEFPGSGEMGVTGVTVDPISGDVFAAMAYDEGGFKFNRVVRFHSTDGGHTAATQTVILSGIPAGISHQIQALTIGPDGKLYVNVGDGWTADAAPDLNERRGKILRMNLDGSIPPDNPFSNSYIYASGVRNPFGAAWRSADGKLYISDNGPENNDRLAKILPGQNYGWNLNSPDLTKGAIFLWNPTVAPVAIDFMDETAFPAAYRGQLFAGLSGPPYQQGYALLGKKIQRFVLDQNGNVVSDSLFLDYVGAGVATVIGVTSGPDGLYFTDLYGENGFDANGQTQGNVYRIRWAAADATPPVISNVQATNLTGVSATIVWQTDEPATRQVEYGLTSDYGQGTPYETNFATSHSVTLQQLQPESTYHFRVWSGDAVNNNTVSSDFTFTTTAIDSVPPVISAVRVDSISANGALVRWNTNEPATSVVDFGATIDYGLPASDDKFVTTHRLWLAGLTDTTSYHFRVRSRDASNNETISNDSTFTTLLDRTLLADDFNGGALNTLLWQLGANAGNNSTVANNALELRSQGTESGWVITRNAFAARNTVVSMKVVKPNDDGDLGVCPTTANLASRYGIYEQANWYRFYIYRSGGAGSHRLYVQWKKNGVTNEVDVTGNFVINGAVYLRLRFDDTNIHFEASLDGATWTDTYTEVFGLPGYTLDAAFFYELSAYNTNARGVLVIDDFSITKSNASGFAAKPNDHASATAPIPTAFSLQNYPNPLRTSAFNAATRISLALPHDVEIHLAVYDLAGREVKELMAGSRLAGSYEITWDSRNREGGILSTGVYLLRLRYRSKEGGAWSQLVRRMLMAK
ncbi:MAG: PQQ-dependent sugar dehydrogenase, partial [bacterium]